MVLELIAKIFMDVLYEVFQINIIIIYNDSANEIHLVPVFLLYNTWYFY